MRPCVVRGTLQHMVVCHCERVNERTIRRLIRDPDTTVEDIIAGCGAGSRCGGCRDTIDQMMRAAGVPVGLAVRVAAG